MNEKVVLINFAKTLLFSDSSSEEDDICEKVENYAELTVPYMSDKQFQQNFRITVATFEDLLWKSNQLLLNDVPHVGFPKTELDKELMITIWYLSNLESLRSVAERFGVTKSTCWDILYRTCKLLLRINTAYKIISWPSRIRQQDISANFARQHGFPGTIGCIDGSHIRITAPQTYPNSYVNRKNFHSLLLQGVCDHQKLFLDVYAGEAGSIHDYTLFRRSDLYRRILNGEIQFDDNHIIGDLAYKVSTFLLSGFKNNGHLTLREKNFNTILSKARVTIEIAFAYLKGRFRRLKFLETKRLDLTVLLIVSACVLHNVCILNGDLPEEVINLADILEDERRNNPQNVIDYDAEGDNRLGLIKRNNICNALPMLQ